jgi:hypothetical protein
MVSATTTRRLESVPVGQIAEHASQVRAGQVLATAVTAVFFAIGWVFGAAWRSAVFCCLAVRYGYRAGAHVPVAAAGPEPVRGHRPGPGGTLIEE